MLFQVVSIQPLERWTCAMRNSSIWPLKGSAMPLTRAQVFLDPEVLSRDLDRAQGHPNQVGVHALQPVTRQLAETKALRRYPIRKVTTPVPVEGGVEGGALPKSAGASFQGRRKPNGSACHRRTMAGVQEEAKHAISAMSPLKSCELEKPQPQR